MSGASILFLLSCGALLFQAISGSANGNSNVNSNTNSNLNSNGGYYGRPRGPPPRYDYEYPEIHVMPDDSEEPMLALERCYPDFELMRRKLFKDNDPATASVAAAAADAALAATAPLVQEVGESIVVGVANAVSRMLRRRSNRAYRRNFNSNSNSNTNTNSVGSGYPRGPSPRYEHDMGDYGRVPYYDPADDEAEDKAIEEVEVTPGDDLKEEDVVAAEEEKKEAVASKSLLGHGWDHLIFPIGHSGHNTNNNANINSQTNYRRFSNRLGRRAAPKMRRNLINRRAGYRQD